VIQRHARAVSNVSGRRTSRPLKVYGWTGFRIEARSTRNVHGQTVEIVAASSAAEAMRLAGLSRSAWAHSGYETANAEEMEIALARPRVIFWIPLNDRGVGWAAAEPAP